jgi:hypothetical protein
MQKRIRLSLKLPGKEFSYFPSFNKSDYLNKDVNRVIKGAVKKGLTGPLP